MGALPNAERLSYSTATKRVPITTQVGCDETVSFDTVVFDAAVDLSWVDSSRWYVYSFRGHRWTF